MTTEEQERMAGDEEWKDEEMYEEWLRLYEAFNAGGFAAVTRHVLHERAVLRQRAELAEQLNAMRWPWTFACAGIVIAVLVGVGVALDWIMGPLL